MLQYVGKVGVFYISYIKYTIIILNIRTCLLLAILVTKSPFFCVEVLRPSQPNGVMSSAVSLPSHTFTGQA